MLSRRSFVLSAACVGGALVVGVPDAAGNGAAATSPAHFGDFIRIEADGALVVVSKHLEMGQGAPSGLAAIVCDELGADWDRTRVEAAPCDPSRYGHPDFLGLMGTGGSTSIAASWIPLRTAAAAAREMLLAAAAQRWRQAPQQLRLKDGLVTGPAGRRGGMGDFAAAAARLAVPPSPVLKDTAEFRLLGSDRITRLDMTDLCTGRVVYTSDFAPEGALYALVARPPRFGGKVRGYDATPALKIESVVTVARISSGVAVLGYTFPAVQAARAALQIEWDEAGAERRSSSDLQLEYAKLASGRGRVIFTKGAQTAAPEQAPALDLEFSFPFLAHAAMEPMNAVAWVAADGVDIWTASQMPSFDIASAARAAGAPPERVRIHSLPAGGSFGRRAPSDSDFVVDAVEAACAVPGQAVRLQWTREDDMRAGAYRPMAVHRLQVTLGGDGHPSAWRHHVVSPAIYPGTGFEAMMVKDGVDSAVTHGVHGCAYFDAIPDVTLEVTQPRATVPVLAWRSVGNSHGVYAVEHSIDLVARRAGRDPLHYRRALLAGSPAQLALLDVAAAKAGWGRPRAGRALGIASGPTIAQVAEVSLVDGRPRVHRVTVAVDCGFAVAPDLVRAQVEGSIVFGLGAILYQEIRLEGGVAEPTNLDAYRSLSLAETPEIEIHILPSVKAPTGVGEPAVPLIGPAVANALLVLTGRPQMSLPLLTAGGQLRSQTL